MELAAERKDQEINNTTNASQLDDLERISLDLKAGFHPLKVRIQS